MHYYRYSNAEVSCWYKYLLFSYNIIFWLAGVAFLAVGLWAWSEKVPHWPLQVLVDKSVGIQNVIRVFLRVVVVLPSGDAFLGSAAQLTARFHEHATEHKEQDELSRQDPELPVLQHRQEQGSHTRPAVLLVPLLDFQQQLHHGVLSDLTKVTGLHGLDPVVLVLVVGIVMFTLGFAGCVGALRENICLLKFFCGTIVFIFLLELAVAVLAVLFQDWVRDRVKEFFENNIKSYRDDIDLQNLIDSLQKINHCCGAQGPDDWDFNIYFNCSSESKSREKCGVPFSCCIPDPAQKVVNTQCGYDVRKKSKSQWDDQIFIKGCILALEAWLPRNIYIVAGVFIAISLLQIFGIFLARTLISDIEAVKAACSYRPWPC
uniref:Tetraspanin 14 n=1 Tax=Anas platyrhynchos platyrhynchos TaxID=8840 RepID=A0A493TMP1_ANAPP